MIIFIKINRKTIRDVTKFRYPGEENQQLKMLVATHVLDLSGPTNRIVGNGSMVLIIPGGD